MITASAPTCGAYIARRTVYAVVKSATPYVFAG
jgi:hypothetical protein